MELPIDRWFNAVLLWFRTHMEDKQFLKFETKLFKPVAGRKPIRGPWSDEELSNSWLSASAALSKVGEVNA